MTCHLFVCFFNYGEKLRETLHIQYYLFILNNPRHSMGLYAAEACKATR